MSEIIEVLLSQRVRGGWSGPVRVEMSIPQAGEAVRVTNEAGSGFQARFDHTPIGGWSVLSWSGTMSQIFAVYSAAGLEPK